MHGKTRKRQGIISVREKMEEDKVGPGSEENKERRYN